MKIEELDREKYFNDLWSADEMISNKYESPSGVYELELLYAGEYPQGDSYHYCQVVEKSNNIVIWDYQKGDKIRKISDFPWSPDSQTLYFGLIENGNKIARYDVKSENLTIVFKSKPGEKRLNWIHFVPQTFNGVVINSEYRINIEGFVEYFIFIHETGEIVELKHFFSGQIYPCPSNVLNCICVFDSVNIYLFDVMEKRIVEQESNSLLKSGFFPQNKPCYFIKSGVTYLQLNSQTEEKYLKY